MLFRNIVFSSLLAGLIAGVVYGIFQITQISPIIHAAEHYEINEVVDLATDGHNHSHDNWAPRDGLQRSLFSILSNALIGAAFAMFLISLMAIHNLKSAKPRVNTRSGIGWGIAGLLALFVAPALLGMHPEIPGTQAANLASKQLWWIFCVVATAAAIAILYYAPLKYKFAGLLIAALPHLAGAPHPQELSFDNTDPQAVLALTALTSDFYTMTAVGAAIFFILLGALSGYFSQRFVQTTT